MISLILALATLAGFTSFTNFTAFTAYAAELPRTSFNFTQGEVEFVTDPKKKLTVSASCLKPDGKLECEAVSKLDKLSWKKRHTKGSEQNPASTLCEQQLQGKVVVGKTEKGENSFCRMNDGTMVDSGSLIYRARKND